MERLTDAGEKGDARLRQLDAAIAAPEQRHAKVGFQGLDLPAEGAVSEMQFAGSLPSISWADCICPAIAMSRSRKGYSRSLGHLVASDVPRKSKKSVNRSIKGRSSLIYAAERIRSFLSPSAS